jgi:DEAD/DEAH box helicase domain-containing protein
VSLRSISSDNFVIIDTTRGADVIGETSFNSGPSTLHEKAIYLIEGAIYQVEKLDFEGRKAYVRRVDCDYYTDAITYTRVTVLDTFATDAPGSGVRSHGEVHVSSRVVGFKKIKFYTNENVGSGELDLPEQQMHTTAYWLTIPQAVVAALPFAPDDQSEVTRSGLPVTLSDEPRIFIYDNYPGGIGFSEPLFGMHADLLARVRDLIASCECEHGCPTCVGPVGNIGPMAKQVALRILTLLDEQRESLPPPATAITGAA